MRTLRLSLVGTVLLALLGGLSGAVLAQVADERADFVTIASEEVLSEGQLDARGNEVITMAKEASDPRLSGTWTEVWSCGGDPVEVCVASVSVENEDGTWLGQAEFFGGPPVGAFDFAVLEGQGGYAGLTALRHTACLGQDCDEALAIYEGELPPSPDLPTE